MATAPLYPLGFEPILRRLIWGGRRLGTVLHKPIGDASDYAESWEISDYRDQISVVREGGLAGTTIRELIRTRGEELLGPALGPRDQFPLLVKFIDAHQDLSVQVHPDDETGRRLAGDNGKTETWVIVDARPASAIYAGLKPGISRDELAGAIRTGAVEPLLHRLEVRPGDCILIESGTVHAIGAGVLLAEIQQTSDATFRVYDWGRLGTDGKPRPLHIREAMESIDFERGPVDPITLEAEPITGGGIRERLSRSAYFALERLTVTQPTAVGSHDRFTILMGLEGSSLVRHGGECVGLEFGQTVLLPAALGSCEIIPRAIEPGFLPAWFPEGGTAISENVFRTTMRPEEGELRGDGEDGVADEADNLDRRSLTRLFPGLRLMGAIRQAFDPRKLVIAALGLALLQLGWAMLDGLFPDSAAVTPELRGAVGPASLESGVGGSWETLAALHSRLSEPARLLATPLFALLEPRSRWVTMLHALLSVVWLMIIGGICGGAISRIAVVQVSKLRQIGVAEALRFAIRFAGRLILAPLCPLLGLAFCAAVMAAFGLLYRLPVAGPSLAGTLFVVPLALGLVMMLLVAGLVAGWPLLHAAVAAGAENALDALSRTFGYLNQRIGSFAALLVLVWLEGIIGLLLMDFLTGGVIRLTQWGLGLSASEARVAAFFGEVGEPPGAIATATHAFWLGAVRLLAHGWIYSFFWTAAALLYLWLRHAVDGTPWTELEPGGMTLSPESGSFAAVPDTSHSPSAPPASE